MPKIRLKTDLSVNDAFDSFILSKRAQGITDKTVETYKGHLRCISHHLNTFQPLSNISRKDYDLMIISMKNSGLSTNSNRMENVNTFLNELREFEIEKYETEAYLKEELDRLIVEKYNGDFSTFMQKEVLNEDYGDLRTEVEGLYRC